MTFYYRTTTFGDSQKPSNEQLAWWKRAAEKKNWRIVQLPNGYFQTELNLSEDQWHDVTRRETIEGAETAIDSSIEHFAKKLDFAKGPTVVKTFE
jgi:hypothetical protein